MLGIKRVSIENFQSVANATFELEKGKVYAIHSVDPIRRNNVGKSVVMSAMMLIANNINNLEKKYYIRDGEDTLRVRVEDFEGNIVEWARGEEDYYAWTINGKKGRVDKTKGKVPEEVADYFNFHFAFVNSLNKNVSLNMLTEEGRLYFVTTTDNDNYLLLKDLIGTDECVQALKKTKEKRSELESERKLFETRVEDLVYSAKLVEDEVVLNNKKEKKLKVLKQSTDTLVEEIAEIEELIASISKYLIKRNELAKSNVAELSTKRMEATLMLKGLRELKRVLGVQEQLEEVLASKEGLGVDTETLSNLEDKYFEIKKIRDGLKEMVVTIRKYLSKGKELKQTQEELEDILKEKAIIEKELGYCPLCHSSLGGAGHEH